MKNIIYYCFGSAHSSVIASHIHLGDLPSKRLPTKQEILDLADFDSNQSYFIGTLYHKGTDDEGRQVYTMGMGSEMDRIKETFRSMLELSGGNPNDYVFFGALPHINRIAKIGGALSRRYGFVGVGRRMVVRGIIQSYPELIQFVTNCKQSLKDHG